MDDGKHAADHEREHGDRLGSARDGLAPIRLREAKNGRDQRAGVGDANPKNEVDQIKAPKHRAPDSGHADSFMELITPRAEPPKHDCSEDNKHDEITRTRAREWTPEIAAHVLVRNGLGQSCHATSTSLD